MAQYRRWSFRLFTGLRRFSGILAVWAGSLAFSTGTAPIIIQETRPFVVLAKQLIAFIKSCPTVALRSDTCGLGLIRV